MRDGALVDAAREVDGRDPEPGEVGDFFLLGGKPGQGGVFDDVVEREEASEKEAGRLAAAVPDVLDSECAVEGAGVNVAEVLGCAPEFGGDGVFAGNTGCKDALHETARGRHAATVVSPVLGAEEDAAVEAYEGQPGRVATAPAEDC